MKIALCGPANIHPLAQAMDVETLGLPKGIGPTPIAPLALELLKRGHEVTLYTLDYDLREELFFDWGQVRIFVGPSRSLGAVRSLYARERRYLERVIAQDAPTFVHSHWTYEFTLGVLAAGVPIVVTIHDLPWNVLRFFRDRCRAVRLGLAYVVAWRASHFTAVSADAATHFKRYLNPFREIQVIPNFIPDVVWQRAIGPKKHPGRPLVFATVLQGWTRRKNGDAALRAFAQFRLSYPGTRLIMIGTDYQAEGPAAAWAQDRGLAQEVTFYGWMAYDEMLTFLGSSVDVLLMPSRDEALSMTVLENLALGNPIVGGRHTPGVAEQLDGGRAGLLVDAARPEAMAEAMNRLQNDAFLYEQLSRAACERARAVYTPEKVIPQYEQLYQQLMAAGVPRR